jgi:hypothetical protein
MSILEIIASNSKASVLSSAKKSRQAFSERVIHNRIKLVAFKPFAGYLPNFADKDAVWVTSFAVFLKALQKSWFISFATSRRQPSIPKFSIQCLHTLQKYSTTSGFEVFIFGIFFS